MSDPRQQLAELYKRVVQDELGLIATIDELGCVLFEHPDIGSFFIGLNAAQAPEYMKLTLSGFFDATQGVAFEDLVRTCNKLNVKGKLATLTVHEDGYVDAWVGLVFAAPFTTPDEALVRAVIGSAVFAIKRVSEKFADELQKLSTSVPTATHPRRRLAELYQRVVQDELGLLATIEEDGDILFEHPDLGGFFISLNAEQDPEYMKLMLPAFFDATRGVSRDHLVQICNRINSTARLTSLTVHEDAGGSVSAWVGLLLAAPDAMPEEALLRGVIGRAMSSIIATVKLFGDELEKIE
ncbi:MAG TPA: hypothetical protein VN937_00140 [Blastocatellia bacterium]|nr:hypothetical protein [Blastocatellia bacterium]